MRLLVSVVLVCGVVVAATRLEDKGTGDDRIEDIQCTLDDFVANEIQPGSTTTQFSGVSGPCSSRANDEVYVLGGSSDGVTVPVADIGNRLSGSFCVGLMVNTNSANVVPVVTFYSSTFEAIGEITVTSDTVRFSIGESSAVFTVGSTLGFKRYQLCADGSTMTLYDDCLAVGSQSFASDGLTDGETIGLVKDLMDNTADRFLNSVGQLYFLSCSGPGVTQAGMAALQCVANPPNCSEALVTPQAAVDSYILELATSPTTLLPTSSITPSAEEDCSDKEREIERLRAALIAVSVVCGCVLLGLVAVLVGVCVCRCCKSQDHTSSSAYANV